MWCSRYRPRRSAGDIDAAYAEVLELHEYRLQPTPLQESAGDIVFSWSEISPG
jgi:hypothetical protein